MRADELGHMIRHAATADGDVMPFRYGHIATYDPDQHRVRCIIPSMTDQDGNPLLSSWMPMGTLSAGDGFGVQIIYEGGATIDNPTAGEQVLIGVFDKRRGVAAVSSTFFHTNSPPPSTNLPTTDDGYSAAADKAVPGDVIISAPSAKQGGANTFIRLRKSGALQIWSAGLVSADVIGGFTATINTGDANVTVAKGDATLTVAQGNATLQAAQTVNIIGAAIRFSSAVTDALHTLATDVFQTFYNRHTHPNGGFPNPQADASTMTSIVTAE